MNPLVIYHRADFDGIFCLAIARKFLPDADLLGWDYGDPVPAVHPDRPLYILDLSIDGLMEHPMLTWIDHHKTAIAKYSALIPGYRIDGVAACRLAWQWFEKGWRVLPTKDEFIGRKVNEPWAVRLAGEYDIWDKRDPDAELFQHGLRSQEIDWKKLLGGGAESRVYVTALLEDGGVVSYAQRRQDQSIICSNGFDVRWEGLLFLACNAARYNSNLFYAGIRPEHDALLGFNWDGQKQLWKVSLYGVPSKPDVDLGVIATRMGGGGHKQACGFTCRHLPEAWLEAKGATA